MHLSRDAAASAGVTEPVFHHVLACSSAKAPKHQSTRANRRGEGPGGHDSRHRGARGPGRMTPAYARMAAGTLPHTAIHDMRSSLVTPDPGDEAALTGCAAPPPRMRGTSKSRTCNVKCRGARHARQGTGEDCGRSCPARRRPCMCTSSAGEHANAEPPANLAASSKAGCWAGRRGWLLARCVHTAQQHAPHSTAAHLRRASSTMLGEVSDARSASR